MGDKLEIDRAELDKISQQLTYSGELLEKAADEIHRLEARVASLEEERDTLQAKYDRAMAFITTFEDQVRGIEALAHQAIQKGEELEKERDELKAALARNTPIN